MLNAPRGQSPSPTMTVDESHCDREPIHVPGSIQPHGFLLLLDPAGGTIRQASTTVRPYLGIEAGDLVNRPLETALGESLAAELRQDFGRLPRQGRPILLRTVTIGKDRLRRFHAVGHQASSGIILEFELAVDEAQLTDVHSQVDAFTIDIEAADSIADMSRVTCETVQALTGFDRVLIYQFDADWNGTVIGEAVNDRFPSLLDHRFPASDIPAQARELYRVNRVRIIPDATYTPAAIVGVDAKSAPPLDLTFSVLRSVSPVHVEYMRNMGTASSMSISILRDGRLWGLVACHHRDPLIVSFPKRVTCDLFARAFSLRLSALEHTGTYRRGIEVQSAYSRLLANMADRGDFAAAMAERPDDLLSLVAASGAALLTSDQCRLIGETPTEAECRALAAWLLEQSEQDVFATDALPAKFPPAAAYTDRASGLLAIGVSRIHASYVLWFRPEFRRSIRWGGEPQKRIDVVGDDVRLHPRRSFETWVETVRGKSLAWAEAEIEAASNLRISIVEVVLRKAEELAELNTELKRSNRELESFSYSVSHDLRAPLRHIVGYAELLRDTQGDRLGATEARCITNIIESSEYAGKLVDKLLSYSRLGRAELQFTKVDLNLLIDEIRRDVMRDAVGRQVKWLLADLPTVSGDLMMLRMAIRDLAANAVKYTRNRQEAVIEMGAERESSADVIWISDNGVGFDMKYADKLFGVFQRLHRWEDFEGTGIGLANVRRVIERHGGETWAEGAVDRGAKFSFRLPRR